MKSILFLFATLFASCTFANNTTVQYNTPNCTICKPNKSEVIPAGTMVYLELAEQLRSQKLTVGRIVKFTVKMHVKIDGKVVVRTGAMATGRIKNIERNSFNDPEEVNIEINNVQAVDGTMIEVNGTESIFLGDNSNEDAEVNSLQQLIARVMNDTEIEL